MSARDVRAAVSVGFLIAYGLLIPALGFFATSAVFLLTYMLYLGIRQPLLLGGVTIGMLGIAYTVFDMFLGVPLPHGWIY